MENKLFKLLYKIRHDLSGFFNDSLNPNNEVLDKCFDKDENGQFVEDTEHWNKMLVRSKNLQMLVNELQVRLMTVREILDFEAARRILNDEVIHCEYEVFLAFEENCNVSDTRSKCIKIINRTYETAIWLIDETENKLREEKGKGHLRLAQLKTNLSNTQRTLLYDLLVENKFIPDETDKDGFNWVFGGNNKKYTSFKIKWLKNKQLLRELLIPLKHPETKISDIKRIIPQIFIDTKCNAITLANNKSVPSQDSDKLSEIHKKLATC